MLTDILSFNLPFDSSIKLKLLGDTNPTSRARTILALIAEPERGETTLEEFPPGFSAN